MELLRNLLLVAIASLASNVFIPTFVSCQLHDPSASMKAKDPLIWTINRKFVFDIGSIHYHGGMPYCDYGSECDYVLYFTVKYKNETWFKLTYKYGDGASNAIQKYYRVTQEMTQEQYHNSLRGMYPRSENAYIELEFEVYDRDEPWSRDDYVAYGREKLYLADIIRQHQFSQHRTVIMPCGSGLHCSSLELEYRFYINPFDRPDPP